MALVIIFVVVYSHIRYRDVYFFDEEIPICWSRVTRDIKGGLEDSVYYKISAKRIYPDTADVFESVWIDTFLTIDSKQFPEGKYIVGIVAIDAAGNESTVLWSNSEDNEHGKWRIGIDRTQPGPVEFIKPLKDK